MQYNGQLGEFGPLSGGTDGGVTEFLEAERLGRGEYEPPRPGTLVPTDETFSTVTIGLMMLILAGAFLVGMIAGSTTFRSQQPVQTYSTDGKTALAFLLSGT